MAKNNTGTSGFQGMTGSTSGMMNGIPSGVVNGIYGAVGPTGSMGATGVSGYAKVYPNQEQMKRIVEHITEVINEIQKVTDVVMYPTRLAGEQMWKVRFSIEELDNPKKDDSTIYDLLGDYLSWFREDYKEKIMKHLSKKIQIDERSVIVSEGQITMEILPSEYLKNQRNNKIDQILTYQI